MATEKIRIDYLVDKKQLDESNKSLKTTVKANDLTQKEVDETNKKFKEQEKQLSKTNKAFSGLGGQLTAIGNRFQIAGKGVGDLAAGMFKATNATNSTTKAMRILKVAIAATGIGLLITAIGSVAAAFKSSEAGQNKFAKLMDVIGVVVGNVSDVFAIIGENIIAAFENPKESINSFVTLIKDNIINRFEGLLELVPALGSAITQLFKGDFSGAAETAGDAVAKLTLGVEGFTGKVVSGFNSASEAVKEFSDLTKKEVAQAQDLADIRAATNVLEREFLVKTAKLETTVAALRLKARQEDQFSAKERVKAIIEARDIQNELLETEIKIAKNRAEEVRIRNTFSKSTRENLDEEARLQAAVFQLETKRFNQEKTIQRELNTTLAQARTEEARQQKAKQDILDKEDQERADKKQKEAEDLEIKKQAASDLLAFQLEQSGELELAELERTRRLLQNDELLAEERVLIVEEYEQKILEIRTNAAAEKVAIDEKAAATELETAKALEDAKQEIKDGARILLKKALGEDSKAYKAFAIAEATINGALAVSRAFSDYEYPLSLAIAAAAAISTGIQIDAIANTPTFEKGGRIGGNLHSGGGTLIEAERDEFVMSRKATSKYGFDLMTKINNLELNDLTGTSDMASVNIIDTKPIAEQLKNMPQNIMNIDSDGFMLHQRKGVHTLSQKVTRYST